MDIKHFSYQEFLGVNPCDLMHPEKPQILCVHNAKLKPNVSLQVSDSSLTAGCEMTRGNVYVFSSSAGVTLYEKNIYPSLLMADFTKSLDETNEQLFSKIVSFLVHCHL